MPSIRSRTDSNLLFFEFRFLKQRFREQTMLSDTPANRKKLEKVLNKVEAEIIAGTFDYVNYFPNSKALKRLAVAEIQAAGEATAMKPVEAEISSVIKEAAPETPLFKVFANQWVDEHSIEWRRSHIRSLLSTLNSRLIPDFGGKAVGHITKADILAFRGTLAKVKGRGDREGLSPKRINEIIGLLNQILEEAADRFDFTSPCTNIKRLRVRKTDVDPFNLTDVQRLLATVRSDYRQYFVVRFFTGMRTGEVHGLKWKYLDFDLRIIRVRETFVLGEDEYTKTDGSQRDIQMSQPVFDALQAQYEVTGIASEYVFCNLLGTPLDNKNFSDRIWYPLLRHLGLEKRRPYQMRHTAATLWLASGEAPEWIARQLGHTSTEMLFRVYSRYVPNLTRQDGSAMERLLASRLGTGSLVLLNDKSIPDATDIEAAGKIRFHQSTGNLPLADAEQGVHPKSVYASANQAQRPKALLLTEKQAKGTAEAPNSFPQTSESNHYFGLTGDRSCKTASKLQTSSGTLPRPPPSTCRERTKDRLPTQLI